MAKKTFETEFAGKKLTIEICHLAQQANGSCTVRYGDTVVLATAVMGGIKEGMDYFPLAVEYEERLYAAGKIKGSRWIKREGRPSDEAVLTARLVDRCIRPLFFHKPFYRRYPFPASKHPGHPARLLPRYRECPC